MFKKILLGMFLCLFLNTNILAQNKYTNLKENFENMDNSVIEIFFYGCDHCYAHHQGRTLAKMKEKLPNFKFYIFPYTFKSVEYGIGIGEIFAYGQAKDDEKGIDASSEKSLVYQLSDAYLKLIFVHRKRFDLMSEEEFAKVGLRVLNISKKDIENFLKTSKAKEILAIYQKANDNVKIHGGVPLFIVNGKFKVNLEFIDSLEDMVETVKKIDAQK